MENTEFEEVITVEIPAPIVKSPNIIRKRGIATYHRVGRGFSVGELKHAGLTIQLAKQFNVPIDFRRRSVHQSNVENLKKFVEKISVLITAKKTKPAKTLQQKPSQ